MTDRLEATAFHEAGHAVLTIWHDRSFRKASIVATDDYLGKVYGNRTRLQIERLRYTEPTGARLRRWAETTTQILLAGGEAERRFRGRRNNVGRQSDLEKAFEIAWLVNDGAPDTTSAKWLEWQIAVTEDIVSGPAWKLIERGAAALLERRTLTGREFGTLVGLDPSVK